MSQGTATRPFRTAFLSRVRLESTALCLGAFAYVLAEQLRTIGLRGTALATATVGTIRTRLLRIGTLVEVSVRRVLVRRRSAFPLREVFAQAWRQTCACTFESGWYRGRLFRRVRLARASDFGSRESASATPQKIPMSPARPLTPPDAQTAPFQPQSVSDSG